jgi:hypothetical protein
VVLFLALCLHRFTHICLVGFLSPEHTFLLQLLPSPACSSDSALLYSATPYTQPDRSSLIYSSVLLLHHPFPAISIHISMYTTSLCTPLLHTTFPSTNAFFRIGTYQNLPDRVQRHHPHQRRQACHRHVAGDLVSGVPGSETYEACCCYYSGREGLIFWSRGRRGGFGGT